MNWTPEDLTRRNWEVLGVGTSAAPEVPEVFPPSAVEWPEWKIEAECTRLLEQDGWRPLRTDPVSDKGRGKGFGEIGMADHLYFRYAGGHSTYAKSEALVLWVEFKSGQGKPKKHQIEWHTKERARGALTLIAGQDFPASVEGFVAWYRASGLNRGRV